MQNLHGAFAAMDKGKSKLPEFGSKRSLKCVFLYNSNKYGSIPIGHSTSMKEPDNLSSLGKDKVSRTPVDDLRRLEDSKLSPWPTNWLHEISLLYLSLG